MTNRIFYRDSMFEASVLKYLYSKDVYFIHQAIIQKKPINLFDKKSDLVERDGDIVSLKIPIREPEEGDEIDPNPFGSWLIDMVTPKIDNVKMQDFWAYKNFYWMMELQPSIYRYTLKKIKKIKWVQEHRAGLAYMLLFDLLSEEIPNLRDANISLDEEKIQKDEVRQRRLLRNEYYPELFFQPISNLVRKKQDRRIENYTSILTDHPKFGIEYWQANSIANIENQRFNEHLPQGQDFENQIQLSRWIRKVTANEIEDIIEFGNDLNLALDRVLSRIKWLDGDRNLIVKEIRQRNDIVDEFRDFLNAAVYIRWFSEKTLNQRLKYLNTRRRLSYSDEEANRLIQLMEKHYKDFELITAYLYFGQKAFQKFGKPDIAEKLENIRKNMK